MLAMVALVAACLSAVAGAMVALLAQPSFTRLEQAALNLVPPDVSAQPPRELVPPLGAFDRAYEVEFAPPPAVEAVLSSRAERLGWRALDSRGAALRYTADGMVAVLDPAGAVTVEVAGWVRRAQWAFIGGVALFGGVAVPTDLGRRWRRQPRPVPPARSR